MGQVRFWVITFHWPKIPYVVNSGQVICSSFMPIQNTTLCSSKLPCFIMEMALFHRWMISHTFHMWWKLESPSCYLRTNSSEGMWMLSTSNWISRQFYKQVTQNSADLGNLKFSLRSMRQDLFVLRTAAYIHSHSQTVSLTLQNMRV